MQRLSLALVRAPLWRRIGFVLALLWWCLEVAPALWWQRLRWWLVRALALSRSASGLRQPSWGGVSTSRPSSALSCAQGISASCLAAMAFSILPASSTLGVLSAGRCSDHDRWRPPSFVRVDPRGFNIPHARVLAHGSKSNRVWGSRAAKEDR